MAKGWAKGMVFNGGLLSASLRRIIILRGFNGDKRQFGSGGGARRGEGGESEIGLEREGGCNNEST